MTKLTGEQLESACELIETRRRDQNRGTDEVPSIIAELLKDRRLAALTDAASLLAAYRAWKRKQRVLEDHGDAVEESTDPDAFDLTAATELSGDPGPAVQAVIGKLLEYLGHSMVKQSSTLRASQRRLEPGETARAEKGFGEITLPNGERIQWLAAAVIIERNGVPVKCLPECRYRGVRTWRGKRVVEFGRIVLDGSEADLKRMMSSFGALLYLYNGPGAMSSARKLAAALGITVANVSHHARRLAGKNIKAGGHFRFPSLRNVEALGA